MRNYETVLVLDPTLGEQAVEAEITKFGEIITHHGGKIVKQDRWGARTLAYPIAGKAQGFYVVTLFEGESRTVSELERAYKLDEQVLRYLTVVVDKKHLAASQKTREAHSESTVK